MSHAPTTAPTLLLTPPEAAKALGISTRTLWTLTASGDVPSLKIGRLVRYPVDALRDWIDQRQAPSQRKGTESGL
jgi:excisionase family DNA binding protein